jgi:hypothetical protein
MGLRRHPVAISVLPRSISRRCSGLKRGDLYLCCLSEAYVIDISYVGSKGNHRDTSDENFNSLPPQPVRNVNVNRPYPTFGTMLAYRPLPGASSYKGLNLYFEHRPDKTLP